MAGLDFTSRSPCSSTSRPSSPLHSRMPIRESPSLLHPTLHSTLTGTESQGVISFLGVPYATLAQRWTFASSRDDIPPKFLAVTHGPKCPQPVPGGSAASTYGIDLPEPEQDEDEFRCLNLNIYRPLAKEQLNATGDTSQVAHGTLPVLVWFHGGAFLMGSASDASTDPTSLVQWAAQRRSPIMVVSVNYRLGPFGFLYSSDLDEENRGTGPWLGNFGLHDQRLALHWIQRHIRGFGGDPTRVTIAGQSSGAYAIHAQISANTHFASHPSLFARAIIQSGPLAPRHIWSMARLDRIWQRMLSEDGKVMVNGDSKGNKNSNTHSKTNPKPLSESPLPEHDPSIPHIPPAITAASGSTSASRVAAMRSISPERLTHLAHIYAKVGTWGVLADGVFISPKLYDAEMSFKSASPRVEAIMIGDCADERSVFISRSRQRGVRPLFEAVSKTLSPGTARSILSAYSLSPDSDTADSSVVFSLSHLAQDMRYLYPTDALAEAWAASIRYHVSLPNPLPSHISPAAPGKSTGPSTVNAPTCSRKQVSLAHHAVDNMYIFRNYAQYFDRHGYDRHLNVSDEMGGAWIAFVSGHEPWPGAETSGAAHFGRDGMVLVDRKGVRLDVESGQRKRLAMWGEVGLVAIGRIANEWMSEQDDRGEGDVFVI